jgi:succinoglycan biosynthesis protein ExoM
VQVAICVSTYKRPTGLGRLLDGLNELTFGSLETPTIEVIVVDNEARGTAREITERLRSRGFRWPLRCLEEPTRGITYARNRGLEAALPTADFIAFIDDDEVPDPAWLEALILAQFRHRADAVTGPVFPRFESASVPGWITRGGYFQPKRRPDGHTLEVAFTNNVLMRAGIARQMNLRFDHQFALTGGEDTDFFMRVHRAGYRIVWASAAVVHEAIPPSRTTVGWILRRGYREWGSHSRCERALYPNVAVRAGRVIKAATLVAGGLASLPVTALLGPRHMVRSMLTVARGLGSFAGLLGHHYAEYEDGTQTSTGGASSASPSGRFD